MDTVYVNLYPTVNSALTLPDSLLAKGVEVECLKGVAPDDGEANIEQSKYRIDCPERETKALINWLNQTGKSLMYWVVRPTGGGETRVIDTGEFNSTDANSAVRLFDSKRLLELWFSDHLETRLAA